MKLSPLNVLAALFGFSCLVWLKIPHTPLTLSDLALAALAIPALLRCRTAAGRAPLGRLSAAYLLIGLSGCLAILSGGGSVSMGAALKSAAQLSEYLILAPLVLTLLPEQAPHTLRGLAAGFVVNLLGALIPSLCQFGAPAGGLLLSRTGYGIGMALAAALILQRDILPLPWTTAPWANVAALLYGAAVTTVSGLASGAIAIAASWKSPFIISARQLKATCFIVAALAALLAFPARRAALRDCLQFHDDNGVLRRFVQERICASRAIQDRPLLGHGLGRYQSTVGLAAYRGTFPRPSENKVELNSQSGYQVLGVEGGCAAMLLLGLGLAVAAAAALRRRQSPAIPLVLLVGLAFTPLLISGAGPLVALAIASFAVTPATADVATAPAPRARRAALLLILWLAALIALPLLRLHAAPAADGADDAAEHELADQGFQLLLEAESLTPVPPFQIADADGASAQRAILVPDRILETDAALRQARLPLAFTLENPVTVHLWLRVRWQDGCGNSIYVSWNGSEPTLVGNDGTYQSWHWVAATPVPLPAGQHELAFCPNEDGLEIDQILLTEQADYTPAGKLTLAGHSLASQQTKEQTDTRLRLPVAITRPQPFQFAICGPYRGGYEAVLTECCLPFKILYDKELESADSLKDCSVVLLTSPLNRYDLLTQTVRTFVQNGGTAVLERVGEWGRRHGNDRELFPGHPHVHNGGKLIADDNPLFFKGLPVNTEISIPDDLVTDLYRSKSPDWQAIGAIVTPEGHRSAAFWQRSFGKGTVIVCSEPLSFHTMWRDRLAEPVLRNLLIGLAERYQAKPLIDRWHNPLPTDVTPFMDDDFMRTGDAPGAPWTVLSGAFPCTGDQPPYPDAEFALHCTAPGALRCGTPDWRAYRVAVALSRPGVSGLRFTLANGSTLTVTLDTAAKTLDAAIGDWRETALLATLNTADNAWQRLSCLPRADHSLELYLNGQIALQTRNDAVDAAAGPFELFAQTAGTLIDDVSVRPLDLLLPGTDRAPGEEGSCLALGRLADNGIERSTVFTPLRQFRADPTAANAFQLWLPVYAGGTLLGDGRAYRIPENTPPNATLTTTITETGFASDLTATTPGWRDYVFKDRLTDWFWTGAPWTRMQRWSCDTRWSWLGTNTGKQGTSVLWHRAPVKPPYAFRAFLSVSMNGPYGSEWHRGRDINLVFGGDAQSPAAGWQLRVMKIATSDVSDWRAITRPEDVRGCELWHDGVLLAANKTAGLTAGHTLHHNWYEVGVTVHERTITAFFEGRPVITYDVPEDVPLPEGYLGLWTERNAIQVARAQISVRP